MEIKNRNTRFLIHTKVGTRNAIKSPLSLSHCTLYINNIKSQIPTELFSTVLLYNVYPQSLTALIQFPKIKL